MTAIILLNWNGADDTLACLESLKGAGGEFFVVVVDNASADDSVERLEAWKERNAAAFPLHVLAEKENHGFAKGNNVGVRYAAQFQPDSYMLLNNDTEVEPDFLTRLTAFQASYPDYKALSPQINYFYDKEKVWFCGGRLSFGARQLLYKDCREEEIREREFIPVTFLSGCALFFHASLLQADGTPLTERFFFGEEDYEFSLRMRRQRQKMACVLSAKIYHKVGASRDKMGEKRHVGKDYAYYLSKLICNRLYVSRCSFVPLSLLTALKSLQAFRRDGLSALQALRLSTRLLCDGWMKEGIGREDFFELLRLKQA